MQSQNQWPFPVHRDVDLPALKETLRSKYESRKQPHTGMMRALIVTAAVSEHLFHISLTHRGEVNYCNGVYL